MKTRSFPLLVILLLPLLVVQSSCAPSEEASQSGREAEMLESLSNGFVNPPASSRPGAFWPWLNGDVTKESITHDMEEMKDKGMSGAEIWDIEARYNPDGAFGIGPEFLGDESVELIKHALSEGKRLDLRMGLIASSGWNAGGSWVTPDWAAKALYSSETKISGGQFYSGALNFPELPEDSPTDSEGNPVYSKEIAVIAIPDHPGKKINKLSDLVMLNEHFDGNTLSWEVPEGDWTILRFVSLNTGQHLIVPSPNSNGLFIDFFDPSATKRHLAYILNRLGITKENAHEAGLAYMEFDSMELDEATAWTDAMDSIFETHHGYNILPYLPALNGWELPEGNAEFLYDFKKTVSDQIICSHYTTGRDFLDEYGIELVAEAGGPGPPIWDSCPVDSLKALGNVTVPRGEFWVQMSRHIFLIKEVASASHIYGLDVVDAEAFTTWRRWKDSPHALKPYLDRAFSEGLNRVTFVSFSNTRPEHGLPGRSIHAGSDINPAVTWWDQSKPFMEYMSRSSYLLAQGKFVADVAYYYGDKAPNFFPELQGDPERPMIAGLSAGYDFDVVNTDVILNRMNTKDGKIVFPDGLNYNLLVLPNIKDIPQNVIRKAQQLIEAGANVLVQNPEVAKNLEGEFLSHDTIDEALAELSVAKDFLRNEEKIDFIHRRVDGMDIYFVSNKTNEAITESVEFRATNKHVEFWDPVTTKQFKIPNVQSSQGTSKVSLQLPGYGSAFIVFTKEDRQLEAHGQATKTQTTELKSPWRLSFPENWGAPSSVELDELISWTDHEDKGIKYFSGTATYENIFTVSKDDIDRRETIRMDLGEVYDVAEVLVNGESAGILWTRPYQLDIQDLVKQGENKLEVKITNLWINRLTGDIDLPENERFSRTNVPPVTELDTGHGDLTWRIQTSGLLGPVTVSVLENSE
jgi:hypothetical protein